MASTSAPPSVTGVLRTDSPSLQCETVVAVHDDGGAGVMCTLEREQACLIRQLGPDGEERGRSDVAPGLCARWVARDEGGGYLVTRDPDGFLWFAITSFDGHGKRLAAMRMTSNEVVFPELARLAPDGGVIVAVKFRKDLRFRDRRLGTSTSTVPGIVKFPPSLDQVSWSRQLSRDARIASLLPATHDGVDAIVNTAGPPVPRAPVAVSATPQDGSMYGGATYGWRAERVAWDVRGTQVTSTDVAVEHGQNVTGATQLEDTLALLSPNPTNRLRRVLTLARAGAARERIELGEVKGLHVANGRAWVIECECTHANYTLAGTWFARELGGSRTRIALGPAGEGQPEWSSVAMREDQLVAVGTMLDPTMMRRVPITLLARVTGPAPTVDLAQLQPLDRMGLAPVCRSKHAFTPNVRDAFDPVKLDAKLAACGVPENRWATLQVLAGGGLRAVKIDGASDAANACAHRVLEPAFACPTGGAGHDTSFKVRTSGSKR